MSISFYYCFIVYFLVYFFNSYYFTITDEERDMYGLSPISDIRTSPVDTVCKWQFSSRSHVVGVVLNDDLYVIGGYKGHGLGPSNSVWYRRINYILM